jgi:hypothetical protein
VSRLAWGGEEENAFLFAVLGVIGYGYGDGDADGDGDGDADADGDADGDGYADADGDGDADADADGYADADADADADGPVLFALLGLCHLRALVLAALPAAPPGAPLPVTAPPPDHLLR